MLVTLDKKQERILYFGTFIAIALGFIFLRGYMMLIIFSGIMATLFMPVYDKLRKRGQSEGKASFLTLLISALVVIIPVIFALTLTVYQVSELANDISDKNYSVNIQDVTNTFVDKFNSTMQSLNISYSISTQDISSALSSFVSSFSNTLVDKVLSSFSGIFEFITLAIIYIYVFLSMLKNKQKILSTIKKLNPLGDEISELYLERSSAMTKATVRGQFIIAFMQGAESATVLALVGLENLFFFFLVLLTLFSVIPLGAGIITIPLGIVMVLTGNVWQGVVVILNHLLIVTNIDNVMRPRLVPKSARLDPALMILAVFSGMALYGFIGIVVGPIIMILIITTLQIYNEVFYKQASIDRSKQQNGERFGRTKQLSRKATSIFKRTTT